MAGVLNNTARVYNLKGLNKDGGTVVVRVLPGFNVVDDEHWSAVKGLDFTKALRADDKLDFGTALNKKDGQKAPSKQTPKLPEK
jgi:hypothetical protein